MAMFKRPVPAGERRRLLTTSSTDTRVAGAKLIELGAA